LARLTGARSVIHVHVKCGEWMSRLVRGALVRADAVIGVSGFVASSLIEGGCSPRRTHAVLNAIDLAAWDYGLDPGALRQELGVPPTAPVLVSISRLFHWKGQADLLRAVALVRREIPDVRLLVVGEDDPAGMQREPFSIELRRLAAELGIGEQVVFTGFRRDVARLLAASDIYAMPSFEEPFGLVFLEAMAMKKPVVALESGGVPEVVEHAKTGLLSAPRDPEGLAANILTLIRSPELRARMGEQGRRRAEERFTPQRMALDTGRVYSSLLIDGSQ
jgi:glycosyltransferase involved in cell wall biosynthesis